MLENLIFDRTQSDVALGTKKGYYNAEDLNRVCNAIEYLTNLFYSLGYNIPTFAKTDWKQEDIPNKTQMKYYIDSVKLLRYRLHYVSPDAPASMEGLTYQEANDIEEILYTLEDVLEAMQAAFLTRQANTLFMIAGGVFNNV